MTHPALTADSVAVVTGAASGIGRATAERFVTEGCKVAAWDVIYEIHRDAERPIQDDLRVVQEEIDALFAAGEADDEDDGSGLPSITRPSYTSAFTASRSTW